MGRNKEESKFYYTKNGSFVENIKPCPRHRITGVNAYKDPSKVEDEWARVQHLRQTSSLVEGGNKLEPTNIHGVIRF